jgi:hypothetical protein
MLLGNARQRCDHPCRQRPRAAHVDVEAAIRSRDLDVERLCDRYQRLGDRAARIKRAAQAGGKDRTAVDRDNVV